MVVQEKIHPDTQNIEEYMTIIKEVLPHMTKPTEEFKKEFNHYCYLMHLQNQMLKRK